MTLNQRIISLENQIKALESKIKDLSANTEEKYKNTNSVVGNLRNPAFNLPVDVKAGMGSLFGNAVIWNNSELNLPPISSEPSMPTKGFNKHSHSRYSGGELISGLTEVVDYSWGSIINKHSQGFLNLTDNDIVTEKNTNGETVKRRGYIDFIFNPDTLKWGTSCFEIDVKKCYLVERNSNGNIAVDSNGNEKKSPLYNADSAKTSVVWDESSACFKFYSVYAPGE